MRERFGLMDPNYKLNHRKPSNSEDTGKTTSSASLASCRIDPRDRTCPQFILDAQWRPSPARESCSGPIVGQWTSKGDNPIRAGGIVGVISNARIPSLMPSSFTSARKCLDAGDPLGESGLHAAGTFHA